MTLWGLTSMAESSQTVYERIGPEGFERLVRAFYRRVATDPLLAAMYPEDLEPAERRLRLFLIQLFGGPTTYSDERGHPRLRKRHLGFRIDQAARDVWMGHMRAALDEAGIAEPTYSELARYFEASATAMINTIFPE
jgi:hemoglobin